MSPDSGAAAIEVNNSTNAPEYDAVQLGPLGSRSTLIHSRAIVECPMPRVDLHVPFAEKDEAKRLGARWDSQQKTWYVPEGIEPTSFKRWLPESRPPNIRAPRWFLASSTRECWCCKRSSHVFAIVLPAGYESLIVEDDPADDYWECGERSTLLSYVGGVSASVASELRRRAPRYRIDCSQGAHFYWMNHCEHCEAKLGDFETLEEVGTFRELGAAAPRGLELTEICEPFAGSCGGYTL